MLTYWDSGSDMHNGWSAVGGQTQSAYVVNGLDPDDSSEGHSVRNWTGRK